MNQIRNVLLIQVLNSFTSGVIGVALPLMMQARQIDIVYIGLVFASMPLIMQLGRIFFAMLSDFWGRKLFFVSNGFLGVISGLIYYFAHTSLEFLFGKITEGTKEGSLWAVNRAFLLEKNEGSWRVLVRLRTVAYVAFAVGSLLAGFLIAFLLFEGTMLFCAVVGVFVVLLSLLLAGERKERFTVAKALQFLDFRKKERVFKVFLLLFLVAGLSFGFVGGFVIPLFLYGNNFSVEAIGLVVGVRILIAGLFSYVFARSHNIRSLILCSGVLFSTTFFLLGFSSSMFAVALVIVYGVADGVTAVGHEGILSKISGKESYGTDIGLLMMGLHLGEALSLALSGVLISLWSFAVPFVLAASTHLLFSVGSYLILKE